MFYIHSFPHLDCKHALLKIVVHPYPYIYIYIYVVHLYPDIYIYVVIYMFTADYVKKVPASNIMRPAAKKSG